MSQIDDDDFIIDIGIMYGLSSEKSDEEWIGYTTLPRHCCLKQFIKDLEFDGLKSPRLKVTFYTWCLTKDIAALTIESPVQHPFTKDGLFFIQIYTSSKNQFECQTYFPYPRNDDSGICLTLGHHELKALYSSVNRSIPVMSACSTSWFHGGQRVGVPLLSNADRSSDTRLEIRMTRTLSKKVFGVIRERRAIMRQERHMRSPSPYLGECPLFIQKTKIINDFVFAVTQVPARIFQEILSFAPLGHLGVDHQKLAIQMFNLQKTSYCAVNLSRYKYLWKSIIPVTLTTRDLEQDVIQPKYERGLGLGQSIKTFGFGYPEHDLINWKELTFISSRIADQFPHPTRALNNLVAQSIKRHELKELFEEIDFIVSRLRIERNKQVRELQLHWLALRILRQYHMDVITYLIQGPYLYHNKTEHQYQITIQNDEESEENREQESEHTINMQTQRQTSTDNFDWEFHSSDSEVSLIICFDKMLIFMIRIICLMLINIPENDFESLISQG